MNYRTEPLSEGNWHFLEDLFGSNGACGGCWCMYWRTSASQFKKNKGEGNRNALREFASAQRAPGLIAFSGKQPVGWCSLGPRNDFPRMQGSRILKPVDELPVWSIVCLFVRKDFRRKGVSVALIDAAVDYARKHGAIVVEAYPHQSNGKPQPDVFVWTGLVKSFRVNGFEEVARRSENRPIMRLHLDKH